MMWDTLFNLETMTTDELRQWRRHLFFVHARSPNQDYARAVGKLIYKIGHKLNERCNTTKYLPR